MRFLALLFFLCDVYLTTQATAINDVPANTELKIQSILECLLASIQCLNAATFTADAGEATQLGLPRLITPTTSLFTIIGPPLSPCENKNLDNNLKIIYYFKNSLYKLYQVRHGISQ